MSSGAEQNARYKLCRDLPAEKGPIFEEWLKELLDAAESGSLPITSDDGELPDPAAGRKVRKVKL